MKITDITFDAYEWDKPVPLSNGLHTYSKGGGWVVRVYTDEGVVGHSVGGTRHNEQASREMMKDLLIGENPLMTEKLWHKLYSPKRRGRRGMETRAQSSLDIALWDIKAKVAGLPLSTMIGGFTDTLSIYCAGGYYAPGKGLKELAKEMEGYVRYGAKAVKMKVGALPMAEDAERVRVVRDAVGSDIKVMIDANCAYRAYEAIQFARMVEPHDVFWFEEPVQPDDIEGYARIAQTTSIPIVGGENEYTRFGFREFIHGSGTPIVQADGGNCGGVTEFMKIASYADTHGRVIAPHGEQQIHVHLLSAIPNGLYLEFYPEEYDHFRVMKYQTGLTLNKDGTVSVPTTAGAGLEWNDKAMAKYKI